MSVPPWTWPTEGDLASVRRPGRLELPPLGRGQRLPVGPVGVDRVDVEAAAAAVAVVRELRAVRRPARPEVDRAVVGHVRRGVRGEVVDDDLHPAVGELLGERQLAAVGRPVGIAGEPALEMRRGRDVEEVRPVEIRDQDVPAVGVLARHGEPLLVRRQGGPAAADDRVRQTAHVLAVRIGEVGLETVLRARRTRSAASRRLRAPLTPKRPARVAQASATNTSAATGAFLVGHMPGPPYPRFRDSVRALLGTRSERGRRRLVSRVNIAPALNARVSSVA